MDETKTTGRSSEEIRAEIERTRADMHETVDQLEARLSPGQILDEVWARMRANGGGGAGDIVRDHPVPLALMGLGVAWLAVEKSTRDGQSGQGYVGSTDRAEGRVGPYRADEVDDAKFQDVPKDFSTTGDMGAGTSGLKDRANGALHGAKDAVGGVAGKVGEKAGEVADGVRERAAHLRESAGETATRGMRGLDSIIHDQPLIAGALTFGIGLAAGLAIPATRLENERLGARSDEVKASAKEAASDMGEKVMETASETMGAVKEAAQEIKGVVDDPDLKQALSTKAREVADVAKGVVEDTAQRASGSRMS